MKITVDKITAFAYSDIKDSEKCRERKEYMAKPKQRKAHQAESVLWRGAMEVRPGAGSVNAVVKSGMSENCLTAESSGTRIHTLRAMSEGILPLNRVEPRITSPLGLVIRFFMHTGQKGRCC